MEQNIKMEIILLCLLLNLYLLEYSTLVKIYTGLQWEHFHVIVFVLFSPFTFKIEIVTLVAIQKR